MDPNWISWEDAQRTRIAALDKYSRLHKPQTQEQRDAKLKLAEDCAILALLTYQPPDRVGVIRRLSLGGTLVFEEDEGWHVDLTKFRHKTSKFYVSSMRIPHTAAGL